MGTVNVNRNVTDVFYRYKMPKINAKVEGKGNGIKTVIVNMIDVAKAIGRPATYPTKYFGCELGAQTQFDYKNERFIVNGSHDASKLQDLLDGFIRKFVLCPECDNPETELLVSSKKGTISQGCKACGFHGPLEVNHKVNTFIIKNPPNINPANQGASLTESKRSKRSKKTGDNGETTEADTKHEDFSEVVKSEYNDVHEDEDDDAEWTVDVSEAAVRSRLQDLTEGAKNMTISEDVDKSEKERLDIFYEELKKRRDAGELDNVQVHKELTIEAARLDVQQKATLVLAELLFDANILQQVKKYRNLLLRFTHNDLKAQKYLIGGLEQIIALHNEKLMNNVATILKLFYDNDILEEKAILEWASKISKKYVSKEVATTIHEKAKPFIQWLQTAEEEEDSSDESDFEVEYNDRVQVLKKDSAPKTIQGNQDEDGEDDVNIDEI
ncbi:eukaryotic translation initiation factor 5 [Culicoides brevitarsis]|uniref:eukaryotic translation initiation factor 5 n=1 Tax=Culicoides brevitarsis TaxID=469753 RepID=UPI00307B7A7C